MGNICIKDEKTNYEDFLYKKYKCVKCGDMFTRKKNSTRFHCRNHRFDKHGICIDCRTKKNGTSCCYHVKNNYIFF